MQIWCSDARISASAAVIHTSTAPSTADGVRTSKPSPSALSMAVTALLPRAKPKDLTLSNSFSRCTWMDVGSDVPSTDSNSSSEMKKNRGNAFRLASRYSDSDFWHRSSFSDSDCSVSRRLSLLHASTTLGDLIVAAMTAFHVLSMAANLRASSGSCCRMSSDEKMPSRYCHRVWTVNHTSIVSDTWFSVRSQRRTCHTHSKNTQHPTASQSCAK